MAGDRRSSKAGARGAAETLLMRRGVPLYAKTSGAVSLAFSVVSTVLPTTGLFYLAPLAVVSGLPAVWGGAKSLAALSAFTLLCKLVSSLTFWFHLLHMPASWRTADILFSLAGTLVMIALLVRRTGHDG